MWAVTIVNGSMLLSTVVVFPNGLWRKFEFSRSLISLGLPRPNVFFWTLVLSICSDVLGLFSFGGGVSGSLYDPIVYTFCFDGGFLDRPSGPLGPVRLLLLQSLLKLGIGLLIYFLRITLPFGVASVCFVPDFAIFGLSVYAHSIK